MKTKVMHIGQLIGGLDVYIRNIVKHANPEIEFVIVHGKDDNNPALDVNGHTVKFYEVPLARSLSFTKDSSTLWKILQIIRKEKPDVIHCHSAKGGTLGRICGFLSGVRTLYTPHAFSFLSTPNKFASSIYLAIERMTSFNSYLLACSESEREMGQRVVKYDSEHALVWHNSIPEMPETGFLAPPPHKEYICYMARPSYQKNPFFLVKVIEEVHKRYPSLHFYLLGVGFHSPNTDDMKQAIEEAGVNECVSIYPWLSHEEYIHIVRHAKLYFTVSRYEGLSLSVLEAMSLGKAIVASDVVGNRDCVLNGVNGYLLPFDEKAYADIIVNLIKNDDLRKEMEKNSLKLFEEKFNMDKQIPLLNHIYAHKER